MNTYLYAYLLLFDKLRENIILKKKYADITKYHTF